MSESRQLPHLIKLLDDESEVTQMALAEQFLNFDGDVSSELDGLGIDLSPEDKYKLSRFLLPSKRQVLQQEWIVSENLDDDWDSFEHMLRVVSDYLHDGVTLRPSLHDSLDRLADEVGDNLDDITSNKLRAYLFANNRFTGARTNYYAYQNSDLSYTLDTGKGNPLTLAAIFQLIARRLDIEVSACNYPGHFLARITLSGKAYLVDCFNAGRLIPVEELIEQNKNISAEAKFAILTPAPPSVILHRVLRNLEHSFTNEQRIDDVLLMQKLQDSLVR